MNSYFQDSRLLFGRVIEYYPETQTADILISVERVFSNLDEKEQVVPRGQLYGVPVLTMSGGGWAITFPIKAGDTCMLAFSQVGYDHWLYRDADKGGTLAGQPTPHIRRCFSKDDGFALVGFNTIPRAISGVSPVDSEWRNVDKEQHIILKENGDIAIKAPTVTIDGDVVVTGDVIASGVSLVNHTHGGVDTGGGNTAVPN